MRHLIRLTALALIASVIACSNTTAPFTPSTNPAGLWSVQTDNGVTLPTTVGQIEVVRWTFALNVTSATGGTFTQTWFQQFTQNGKTDTLPASNTGTFVIVGSADSLQLSYDGTTATSGAKWDGHDQLTVHEGPYLLVLGR